MDPDVSAQVTTGKASSILPGFPARPGLFQQPIEEV
jgi:hypothetical protein